MVIKLVAVSEHIPIDTTLTTSTLYEVITVIALIHFPPTNRKVFCWSDPVLSSYMSMEGSNDDSSAINSALLSSLLLNLQYSLSFWLVIPKW